MITFFCSNCGTKIAAESEHAGAAANCPSCSHDLVVPCQITKESSNEAQASPAPTIDGQSQALRRQASDGAPLMMIFKKLKGRTKVQKTLMFVIPTVVTLLVISGSNNFGRGKEPRENFKTNYTSYQTEPTVPRELAEAIDESWEINNQVEKISDSLRYSTLSDQERHNLRNTIDTFLTLDRTGDLIKAAKEASGDTTSAAYADAVIQLRRENKDRRFILGEIRSIAAE
jgi:DNA-directed RNA polymerase subunit RPC12/RpoP